MSIIRSVSIVIFLLCMFLFGCKNTNQQTQKNSAFSVDSTKNSHQYRVKLRVDAEIDESARDNVVSYIGQSLISLNNISIVNDNPDYRIYVTLSQSKLRGCKFIGHIMSIVVTQSLRDSYYIDKIPHFESLPKHIRTEIFKYDEKQEFHSTYSCGDDNLEVTCKSLVADINANVFLRRRSESANFETENKNMHSE